MPHQRPTYSATGVLSHLTGNNKASILSAGEQERQSRIDTTVHNISAAHLRILADVDFRVRAIVWLRS